MPDIADSPSAADAASLLRDAGFLASLRRDLLRFACLYLNHDDDSAEDAVHIGRTTQVWQIDMVNDAGEITCVSRITMAILAPR